MQKMNLKKIVFGLFVVVAVFGLVGYKKSITEWLKITENQSNEIRNESDWRVYNNERYGFTFKVPKDWTVGTGQENKKNLVLVNNQDGIEQLSISIMQNKKGQDKFRGPCYEEGFETIDESNKCTLNFNAGTGFVYSALTNPEERRFIILSNERLTFSMNNSKEEKRENIKKVDKIINSIDVDSEWREIDDFNVVRDLLDGEYEPEGFNVDDWKVYQNQLAGFETMIPKNWICKESSLDGGELLGDTGQDVYCSEQGLPDESSGKISFLVASRHYYILHLMSMSISSINKNMYSSTIAIRNITPKDNMLIKSFDNDELSGLIFLDGESKYMHANYDLLINYFSGNNSSQNVFDGVLRSFKYVK